MKRLWRHVQWFIERITRHRLDSLAAHVAFFFIISFIPFVAFLLTMMQQIHFSSGMTLIEAALDIFPESVADYLRGLLPSTLESTGILPLAVIAALWSSSMGMVAAIKGLDWVLEAHGTRSYLRLRITAVFYVIIFAMIILVTGILLVFGNTIYRDLLSKSPPFLATLLVNFKSVAGFVLLFLFFTMLYTAVPRSSVKIRFRAAGAAFSALLWVLFSYVFSLLVENFLDLSIYGGLATIVTLMFWLFFCMYFLFLGAEVSVWLQYSGIGEDLRILFGLPPKADHSPTPSPKKKKTHRKKRKSTHKE